MQRFPQHYLPRLEAALALVLALLVGTAPAGPVVLHDSGRTRELAPYLDAVNVVRGATIRERLEQGNGAPPSANSIGLPVHTPEMRSGALGQGEPSSEVLQRLKRLPQPIFLVGSDSRSLSWLSRHRRTLARHGAIGYLVEAQTEEQVQAVRAAGEGLTIVPASGSTLVPLLSLTYYPVLLSARGIEQ
jgi:integrating conjugative element protein (TIGR03765 family)